MRAFCLVVATLAGCATAGKDGNGFNNGGPDAPPGTQHDAPIGPHPDGSVGADSSPQVDGSTGGPMTMTLTQTADTTVAVGSSVTCGNTTEGSTSLNTYYRVFSPSASGITGPFAVTHVDFAAQEAGGTQQVQIFVGTYTGSIGSTLDETKMTPLGNALVTVPATTAGEALSAPFTTVTIPAGATMYAEILTPDHSGTTTYFYVGASAGAETSPAYIKAADCSVASPKNYKTTGGTAAGALILSVTGTY